MYLLVTAWQAAFVGEGVGLVVVLEDVVCKIDH